MSVLGIIEKLLDGFEVEWKKFDDVGVFLRGKRFVKADMKSEGVPCIHYGEMYTHFGVHAKEAKSFLDESVASKLRVANPGDVVIVAAGETIEDIGNGTAWLGESDIVFHDACFSFKSSLDPKYVSYYLRTNLFKEQIRRSVSSGKISSINAKGLGKATIPIPCPDNPEKSLAIQAEIVRILDAFTAMTAELTAELNMRKKQYNYYRDQLLSFEEGEVEWKTLEEVAHFANGKGHEKDISEDGKFIVVNSKFISTDGLVAKYSDSQICPLFKDDILLVMSDLPNGKALSKTFIVDEDERYTLNQRIGGITVKDKSEILPKFLHYYLDRTPQLLKHDNGVDQTNLRKGQILEVKVPILPLQKQEHIVSILDKFDKLTKSLSEGLPREIELRQKQYEYYRDLLLSFPKPEEAAA